MLVWKTEKLSEFTGRVARSGPELAREITHDVAETMTQRIRRRTPVSKPDGFSPGVPGQLRASIHTSDVDLHGVSMFKSPRHGTALGTKYEAHSQTNVRYAPYVEYDTGKYGPKGKAYPIGPGPGKRAIAFYSKKAGKVLILARVMHKGNKGRHMFLRGAASMTDPSIEKAAKPALTKWWGEFRTARPFT